jgi:hypothetical protein
MTSPNQSPQDEFKTMSNITADEVIEQHGFLLDGDLLLKFAELKNFDAARAIFNAWDEQTVFEMENYLSTVFEDLHPLDYTQDQYTALRFLDHLISTGDNDIIPSQSISPKR